MSLRVKSLHASPITDTLLRMKHTLTWAQLNAAMSAIGGAGGLPGILGTVAMLTGATIPQSLIDWLDSAVEKQEPFTISFTMGAKVWTLEVK